MSAPYLRAVDDRDTTSETSSGLPAFEGQDPAFARIKLIGVNNLEAAEEEFNHIDDTVRLYVEGHVTRVDHAVDGPSGKLVRIQTVKITQAVTLPWNFDTGVLDG
jgi:hypothetical protein